MIRKLVWQYNVKTNRPYDRGFPEIAKLSIDTVARYAKSIGADHVVETTATLFDEKRNFPAIDFLTFLRDERYADYDYTIKLDADFLVGPTFPDLSRDSAGFIGIAGYTHDEEKDDWRNIHERTWRNFDLDEATWKKNYCMGGLAGFPSSTKRWFMENIQQAEIDLLCDCSNQVMVHEDLDFRWSITEQSYLNYLLYHAPFRVRVLNYPPKSKRLVYHAGPRTEGQLRRYRRLHKYFLELWDEAEKDA